jgi:DNA-binding MarR family transcriptional regulator
MPNPEDRRSALLRETEKGLGDSLEHLWPYIEEMRGIEEGFTEEERALISRFLKAATEATNQHAERLSKERQDPPEKPGT